MRVISILVMMNVECRDDVGNGNYVEREQEAETRWSHTDDGDFDKSTLTSSPSSLPSGVPPTNERCHVDCSGQVEADQQGRLE